MHINLYNECIVGFSNIAFVISSIFSAYLPQNLVTLVIPLSSSHNLWNSQAPPSP